jgi:uncharacterized protein YjbI with pentapeptide repeats
MANQSMGLLRTEFMSANLDGADFSGAVLTGATFEAAMLTDVIELSTAVLPK